MPDIRTYKNKFTGESFTVDWDGPGEPTDENLLSISSSIKKNKEAPKRSLFKPPPKRPFMARTADILLGTGEPPLPITSEELANPPRIRGAIGNLLAAPSEYIAPEPMPQEEVEQLPFPSRVSRLGRELASGITSPEVLSLLPTLALPGGQAVLPAYFSAQMAAQIPETLEQYQEAPSLETGTRLGATSLGSVAAGMGAARRLRPTTKIIPPPIERPLLEAGVETPGPRLLPPGPSEPFTGSRVGTVEPIQQNLFPPDQLRLRRPTKPLVKLPKQQRIIPPEQRPIPEQLNLPIPETAFKAPYQGPPPIIESQPRTQQPTTFLRDIPPIEPEFRITDRRRITPEQAEQIPPTRIIPPEPEVRTIGEPRRFDVTRSGTVIPEKIEAVPVEVPILRRGIEQPKPTQITGRVVKPSTAERIQRRIRQEERKIPTKPLRERLIESRTKQKEGQVNQGTFIEREKQRAINRNAAFETKPIVEKTTQQYQNNLEILEKGRSTIAEIRATIRSGIKAGFNKEFIADDLANKGWTSENAIKLVERETRKFEGERGAITIPKEATEKIQKIIDKFRTTTDSTDARSILEKTTDFYHRWAKGPEFVVGEKGLSGRNAQTAYDRTLQQMAEVPGEHKVMIGFNELVKFSKEEMQNLHDIRIKNVRPMNAKVAAADKRLTKTFESLRQAAIKSGVEKKFASGKIGLFEGLPSEKYWPRFATKEAAAAREPIIDVIMREKKVSRSRAKDILDDPTSPYFSRAQHQRLLPDEKAEYRINAEVLGKHIDDLGRQIGIARVLGPGGLDSPKIKSLLAQITRESGSRAADTASDVFRSLTRPDFNPTLQIDRPISNFLSTLATARYLTNFVITNSSNAILVPIKATPGALTRSTAKYLYTSELLQRQARIGGSLEQLSSLEYAPAQNIVSRTVGKGIDFSEKHIRSWVNEVGRETATDLFNAIKKKNGLKSRIAKGRLRSLIQENPDKILKQNSLTEAQLRKAGFEMVKQTQGIVSPLSIPEGWYRKGFLIDQVLMFKRYAGIQLGNTIRAAQENPAKFSAMAPPLALAVGEIVGDSVSAWRGTIAGLITDDTVKNAINREVFEQRGKYYANIAKSHGINEENAKIVGRLIDNMQRAFIMGILGDIVTSMAAGPGELTRGIMPGIDIMTEFSYDLIKLMDSISEDIDIDEAAEPLKRSLLRSVPFSGAATLRSIEEGKETGRERLRRIRSRRTRR